MPIAFNSGPKDHQMDGWQGKNTYVCSYFKSTGKRIRPGLPGGLFSNQKSQFG
jgi:hypothetical protein